MALNKEIKDENFECAMKNIKFWASCIYDLADEYLKTKDESKSSPVVNWDNPFYNLGPTEVSTECRPLKHHREPQNDEMDHNIEYKLVGGKIFYIDSTVTGVTYKFYDKELNELTDVQVGDSPYYYTYTGISDRDKYYVFHDLAYKNKTWTYRDDSGKWVYDLLRTTNAIGSGKTNTSIVMAANGGAYINYADSIWNALQKMRTNAINGCTDWFVPSMLELEELKNATDRNGNALAALFYDIHIWSSCEFTWKQAWDKHYNSHFWDYTNKGDNLALVAVRAF